MSSCKPTAKAESTEPAYVCCHHGDIVVELRRNGSDLAKDAADIIDALSRSLIDCRRKATGPADQPPGGGPQR